MKHKQNQRSKLGKKEIAVAVIAIIIIAFFFISRLHFLPAKQSAEISENLPTVAENKLEITFKKEGMLVFTNKAGKTMGQIDIEIANTPEKHQVGLMFRRDLAEKQGMLFIFDDIDWRSFWMKNTILPLDIIFVDEHYAVINFHENTTPFSEQTYPSNKPAKYVVEVNAGFCKRHNIENGMKISIL